MSTGAGYHGPDAGSGLVANSANCHSNCQPPIVTRCLHMYNTCKYICICIYIYMYIKYLCIYIYIIHHIYFIYIFHILICLFRYAGLELWTFDDTKTDILRLSPLPESAGVRPGSQSEYW
jgi:hypothetical protein